MAEITIASNSVAEATLSGRLIRVTSASAAAISSGTAADSAVIKRQFAKSNVNTAATISAKQTRVVRVASANTTASKVAVLDVKKYRTISAKITVSTRMEAYRTDRDIRAEMTDYLPRYYGDFPVISAMVQAEASEATRLHALVEALVFEFYPETATDIGITRFEAECGIVTDRNKSLEARRAEVIKRRRGIGTVTLPKFTEIVNEFYDCTVEEKPNEFRVATTIWSKRGVPENIAEMEREVDAVLPAHLEHEFVPTWLTWGEIEDYGLTGEEAETYTAEELSTLFLIPYVGINQTGGE
ncbi:putative phage tail protein [Paenibacillus urinalis]|uniref:putative phage tail protein n=1 Tax=Paenibacillus urinalis TaxID=521520 RepID=UPI001960EFE9